MPGRAGNQRIDRGNCEREREREGERGARLARECGEYEARSSAGFSLESLLLRGVKKEWE